MNTKKTSNRFDDQHGLDTGIVEAAMQNDLRTVQRIIQRSPKSINEQNSAGLTALMAAAGRGYLRVVKEICSHGEVDWRKTDAFGRTAFDFSYGDPAVFDFLVERQFGGEFHRLRKKTNEGPLKP